MRWQLQLAQKRESGHRPKQKRGRLSGLRRRLRRQQQHSTTLTKQVRSLRSMLVEKKFAVQRMQLIAKHEALAAPLALERQMQYALQLQQIQLVKKLVLAMIPLK